MSLISDLCIFRGDLFIHVSSNCALNIVEFLQSIKSDHTLCIQIFSLVFLDLDIGRYSHVSGLAWCYTFSLVLGKDVVTF